MLTFPWIMAVVALIAALATLVYARRVSRRVAEVSDRYWQLRYEHGQLLARVTRLEPPDSERQPETAQPTKIATFVPLSSLKR